MSSDKTARAFASLSLLAGILLSRGTISLRAQQVSATQPRAGTTVQALLIEGSSDLQPDDDAGAEKAFRQALALAPRSVEILNNLAIALAKLAKLEEAIPLYKRALTLRPGDLATKRNLAIAYFKKQDYARALPLLESISRREPRDFQAAYLTALSYFRLDRYSETAKHLHRASSLTPDTLPPLSILGQSAT